MAAPQHRKKRQIQTSIATYFDKRDVSESTPELDEGTQANLINVGMRVRKSVPEGYKTHKTIQPVRPSLPVTQTSSQISVGHWGSRELAPFSGLHKIGGYSQQESPASLVPAEDDMPYLTSSQDTVSSTQSFEGELRRKRSYDEEDFMDDNLQEMETYDDLATRRIAQPKSLDRRRRMLEILDNNRDFSEAQFLRPDDFGMDEEYD